MYIYMYICIHVYMYISILITITITTYEGHDVPAHVVVAEEVRAVHEQPISIHGFRFHFDSQRFNTSLTFNNFPVSISSVVICSSQNPKCRLLQTKYARCTNSLMVKVTAIIIIILIRLLIIVILIRIIEITLMLILMHNNYTRCTNRLRNTMNINNITYNIYIYIYIVVLL